MKKIILSISFLLLMGGLTAQTGSKELYGMFRDMPASMNNDDLKAIVTKSNLIDPSFSTQLTSAFVPGSQEIYSIGKVEVGKVVHLFYGVVSWYDKATNDYSMNVACSSFNIKSGEMPRGGLQNYLCMTGQDAMKRESTIKMEGDKIIFTMTSTSKENKVEVEKVTYKLAGYLEFVGRE